MDEFDILGDNMEDLLTEPVASVRTPPNLNLDVSTWEGWINSIVLYAAQNPWDFLCKFNKAEAQVYGSCN